VQRLLEFQFLHLAHPFLTTTVFAPLAYQQLWYKGSAISLVLTRTSESTWMAPSTRFGPVIAQR
jgi:hypothetical protein